ncbi:hypothetical protein HS125_18290 [bacterium]|nr:hypothetical protein [bacterium]
MRSPTLATGLLLFVAFCALWLLISGLVAGWYVGRPATPPAFQLFWSSPLVALGALGCARVRRGGSSVVWMMGVMTAALLAFLWSWCGREGVVAGAATLALAAFTPAGVGQGIDVRLRRHPMLARGLVATTLSLVGIELLLQGAAFVVGRQTGLRLTAPAEEALSILCLGDSFTYGLGASSRQRSWPSLLEAGLQSRLPGRPLVVLNAGSRVAIPPHCWPG